jgi:hypothetical protein
MDDPSNVPPLAPSRKRSGSETRRTTSRINFRLLPSERAEVEARADAAGQTLGSYIRSLLLAAPLMRSRRRASIQVLVLTRVLAELNKIGSNVNQIARHVNMLNPPDAGEVRAARADIRRAVEAVLDALERGPEQEGAR